MNFMQEILLDVKCVFKNSEVKMLKVPLWPELALMRIWPQAILLPSFRHYMPKEWNGNKKTERTFFFRILGTLAPDYLQSLIADCRKKRDEIKVPE